MNEPNIPIAEKSNEPSQERIAALAYFIWMCEDCPEGRQDANWHDAERQLLANDLSNSASADPQGETPKVTEGNNTYELSHEHNSTSPV
jgi:Protein of unknown function (DUF2934)